jgi:hypothetical protein
VLVTLWSIVTVVDVTASTKELGVSNAAYSEELPIGMFVPRATIPGTTPAVEAKCNTAPLAVAAFVVRLTESTPAVVLGLPGLNIKE